MNTINVAARIENLITVRKSYDAIFSKEIDAYGVKPDPLDCTKAGDSHDMSRDSTIAGVVTICPGILRKLEIVTICPGVSTKARDSYNMSRDSTRER
ncbi:hypothetical protein CEXT_206231 [Caerostris extrusa]|uniref:Uncharacterized protein n=1 Tax=Caerostris extrusa TaxID=172846 RepID=A0AAV4QTU1_CAEEX|nr:hypothetical protein CEXT_206231 [Caerostris extrusa]